MTTSLFGREAVFVLYKYTLLTSKPLVYDFENNLKRGYAKLCTIYQVGNKKLYFQNNNLHKNFINVKRIYR